MSLPGSWVDSLFSRLSVRYGSEWMRKWEGIDIGAVKADWANELGPLHAHPESIAYGLDHLPPDRPPTVAQFRALCIARQPEGPKQLPAPSADAAVVAAANAAIGRPKGADPKAWAWALRKLEMECQRLTKAQCDMWRAALKAELIEREAVSAEARA